MGRGQGPLLAALETLFTGLRRLNGLMGIQEPPNQFGVLRHPFLQGVDLPASPFINAHFNHTPKWVKVDRNEAPVVIAAPLRLTISHAQVASFVKVQRGFNS